jgi:hypothetical protein
MSMLLSWPYNLQLCMGAQNDVCRFALESVLHPYARALGRAKYPTPQDVNFKGSKKNQNISELYEDLNA